MLVKSVWESTMEGFWQFVADKRDFRWH
jgi:hypothetical protein